MRAAATILAYLTLASHGRRTLLREETIASNLEKDKSLTSFASLLVRFSPISAGFKSASLGWRSPHSAFRRTSQPQSLFNLFAEATMVDPSKALPGRQTPMPIEPIHYVLGTKMKEVPEGHKVAVFANGCFWGSEKGIWRLPGLGLPGEPIYSTAVGYCAGYTPNPTYEECCSGKTGHTEGVRVVYDPEKISFVDILRWFWEAHDPTSGMGQGNDRGTQYRSGFYYFDEEQKALIEASKAAYEKALQAAGRGSGKEITTEIAAASDYDKYGGLWFYAEAYHQQYLARPGARPYCSAKPQSVSLPPFETWAPPGLEHHAPKLPEEFWKKHAPGAGCKVVYAEDAPLMWKF